MGRQIKRKKRVSRITFALSALLALLAVFHLHKNVSYRAVIPPIPTQFRDNMHTVDLLDEIFSQIRERENINDALREVNRRFHSSQEFDFLEFKFTSAYDQGSPTAPPDRVWKTVCLGEGVQDYFSLEAENGAALGQWVPGQQVVPVLLGSQWKGTYSQGDSLQITVDGLTVTGEVAGFLKEDQFLVSYGSAFHLNDCLLMPQPPLLPQEDSRQEREYNFRQLLDRNNGLVVPRGDLAQVQQQVEKIGGSLGLPYTLSISYNQEQQALTRNILLCVLVLAAAGAGMAVCIWRLLRLRTAREDC